MLSGYDWGSASLPHSKILPSISEGVFLRFLLVRQCQLSAGALINGGMLCIVQCYQQFSHLCQFPQKFLCFTMNSLLSSILVVMNSIFTDDQLIDSLQKVVTALLFGCFCRTE